MGKKDFALLKKTKTVFVLGSKSIQKNKSKIKTIRLGSRNNKGKLK